jgi:hypothetical protein
VLCLDRFQPRRNFSEFDTRNFFRIEIGLLVVITLWLALNACDKLREFGHVLAEKLNGFITEFPSFIVAA